MSLNSLLIPHDGSPLSGSVVEALGPLLQGSVRVTLLHVDDGQAFDEGALDEAARKLTAQGASVTRREVASRDTAGAILDVVKESRPDLVVMSTHGRSGIERWVRGSVAERVLRFCPVPLFMVNPHTHAATGLSSVLVPLDTAADATTQILDPLLPLAQAFGARLTLLFVDWEDPTDAPARAARRREIRSKDVADWLVGPRARIEAAGVPVEIRIEQGDIAEQIVRAAVPGEYDLLAMTTHGRSGPGRWLLGSITEKVVAHCRIPILLCRTTGEA